MAAAPQRTRVFLEEADRPPPSYYDEEKAKQETERQKNTRSSIDPEKWVQAAEFVPRQPVSRQCAWPPSLSMLGMMEEHLPQPPFFMPPPHNGLHHHQPHPHHPHHHLPLVPPPPFPLQPPHSSLPFVPSGYSANITNINPGPGPPIPAILLKKKRRKRHRNHTNSVLLPQDLSIIGGKPEEEKATSEEQRRSASRGTPLSSNPSDDRRSMPSSTRSDPLRFGSCPDLSEAQLRLWDNLLFETVVQPRRPSPPPPAPKNAADTLLHSTYECVPPALLEVAEQAMSGFSSKEVRRMDNEINGNVMTASTIMHKMSEVYGGGLDSDASLIRTLTQELEEPISFRPKMTKYGYPQLSDDRVQLATFNPDANSTRSTMIRRNILDNDDEDERYVEDALEGFNIRVNAFEDCDDALLSESDLPPPSRFQQIHSALQLNSKRYAELKPPERVCCSLM